MAQETADITKKCPTCGAVLVTSPEDLVITCGYCGETIDVDGKKIPNHNMLPSQEGTTIEANVQEFLKKHHVAEGIKIEELKAVYLPYWVVPFSSSTQYYGVLNSTVTRYRTVQTRDAQGHTVTRQQAYTVPVYRDERGSFNRSGRENCIGRKHTVFYGFDKFQDTLVLDNIQPFDFQKVKKYGAEFVNAEVDANEAQRDAYGRVENANRGIAAGKVSELIRCDSQIQVQYPTYVHAPLWQARYKFEGKNFKVSAAGDSGKVVKGEVPLTFKRRMLYLIIGLAMLFVFAFVAETGYGLTGNLADETMQTVGWVLLIVGLVLVGVSFFFTSRAFMVQLEKSDKIKRQKKGQKPAAPQPEPAAPQPEGE
jgi:ribosomal protein S27AE